MSIFTGTRGNALFLILIAVALFAALSFAITQSDRNTGATVSREENVIAGSRIIEYAGIIKQAISRLRLSSGCTDNQLSFENAQVTGYTNPSAPVDKSCHVFDPAGGHVSFQPPSAATQLKLDFEFNGANMFANMGTTDPDLALFLPINSRELCLEINKALGLPKDLAIDWIDNAKFTGTYVSNNAIPDDGGNVDGYTGAWSACLEAKGGVNYPRTAGAGYFFYSILVAR